MPDLRAFLPQPPWNGPPIPRGSTTTLYHASPRENVPDILKVGLYPSGGFVYLARTPKSALEQGLDAAFERGEKGIPDLVVLELSGIKREEVLGDWGFDEDLAIRRRVPPEMIRLTGVTPSNFPSPS